jgi:4,4'-diaponeurosporenoate glycosyltransferase
MTVWLLVLAGWSAGTVLLWRLPDLAGRSSTLEPPVGLSVAVVVPARDEAGNLPILLASLAEQGRTFDVVVVDDGSTDQTAGVARASGATVIEAPPRPAGWLGKPWALQVGVEATTADVLVLLDADVRLAPGALDRLLAVHAAETPDGLLSVQPHHLVEHPYEHLSLLPNIVPLLASGVALAGRERDQPDTIAFGPCLVTTRTALDAAGGLRAVAGEVTEDLALARAYRAGRRPVRVCTGGRLVQFRMYPEGVRSLVQGWTKNLAAGAAAAPLVPALGAALWVAALLRSIGVVASGPWPVALAVWALFAVQVRWMSRRVGSFSVWASVLYPVWAVAFAALFASAAFHHLTGRPVVWRGRRIRTGEVLD